jgi:hypothetical protein
VKQELSNSFIDTRKRPACFDLENHLIAARTADYQVLVYRLSGLQPSFPKQILKSIDDNTVISAWLS